MYPFPFSESYFSGLSEEETEKILTSPKIVNVVKGCSVGCDFCAMAASPKVQCMPWPWVVEIASKIWSLKTSETLSIPWAGGEGTQDLKKNYISSLFFDSDPLRDYDDPFFDKDFADVYGLFNPTYLSTAGFERGSIGERAARKLVSYLREIGTGSGFDGIRVSFTLESAWARRLTRERFVEEMKNVFDILKPDAITLLTTDKNREKTLACFEASYGRPAEEVPGAKICSPHFEGKAKATLTKEEAYYQEGGSVCCIDAYLLNPDGSIVWVERNRGSGEKDYTKKLVIPPLATRRRGGDDNRKEERFVWHGGWR